MFEEENVSKVIINQSTSQREESESLENHHVAGLPEREDRKCSFDKLVIGVSKKKRNSRMIPHTMRGEDRL